MSFFELGWKWMSFLSFGLSVIAAVLAIDMYKLSRTGQFGSSWRVLITASVIYALLQASHLAESAGLHVAQLSRIIELIFVLALAYSFYLQRRIFLDSSDFRRQNDRSYQGPERRNRSKNYDGPERRKANQKTADDETSDAMDDEAESDIEWRAPQPSAR